MIRTLFAIVLLILAGLALMIFIVGSHGHLMFRPHMVEDWLFWGTIIIFSTVGIFLLITKSKNN